MANNGTKTLVTIITMQETTAETVLMKEQAVTVCSTAVDTQDLMTAVVTIITMQEATTAAISIATVAIDLLK